MSWLKGVRARLRSGLRRGAAEARMEEEFGFHLELEIQKNLRAGMRPSEARRRALMAFGGMDRHGETMRDERGGRWLEDLVQDVRYASRTLRKRPGFTAATVLTLALGIGANTALFTAVDALLLRPLAGVAEPERLVELSSERSFGAGSFSFPEYELLRGRTATLEDVAVSASAQLAFGDEAYSEEVSGLFVSGNYFRLLGVRAAQGRLITSVDDLAGRPSDGIVLSHGTWKARFGEDPAVVGRSVRLNGVPVTVLGVAPEEFTGTSITRAPALWAPLGLHERVVPNSGVRSPMSFSLAALGRLAPGVGRGQAEAELGTLAAGINEAVGGPMKLEGVALRELTRIPSRYEDGVERFALLLLAATTLVLLIAGVNVAGMLLVRAFARQREMAVRLAMGAARPRLVRQMLTEGMVLFLLGGAGGVLLAYWMTELLLAFRWPVPVALDLGPDPRVLAYALTTTLIAGLAFGLVPALRSTRPDLVPALKDGPGAQRRSRARLGTAFVVGQLALALLLLTGAGLFLRALQHATSIDPGFEPEGLLVASVDLHRQGYGEPEGRQLYAEALERVRAVPGVESATLSVSVPLGPGGEMLRVAPAGAEEAEGAFIHANVVEPGFFRTMGIGVLRGRGFTDADHDGAPAVAVVNEALAERLWPGDDATGKRLRQTFSAVQRLREGKNTGPVEYEVVGVVPASTYSSLREQPEPHLFVPFAQSYRARMILSVRPEVGREVAGAVRNELHALDPALPLLDLTPLEHVIGDALLPQRVGAVLTTLFGILGLVLAAVGVFGVMAYSVRQRAAEIGIRMALGAPAAQVLRAVLARGAGLTLIGIGIGLALALAATRYIESFLFGVSATDAVAFTAVAVLLAAVALVACYIPARRAAHVDPMVALRSE